MVNIGAPDWVLAQASGSANIVDFAGAHRGSPAGSRVCSAATHFPEYRFIRGFPQRIPDITSTTSGGKPRRRTTQGATIPKIHRIAATAIASATTRQAPV